MPKETKLRVHLHNLTRMENKYVSKVSIKWHRGNVCSLICKQFTVCWLYQNNLSVNFTQEYHFPPRSCVCVTRVWGGGGLKKGKIHEQRPHLDFIFKLSSDTNAWHFYSFYIKFKYTWSVGVNHTQSFSFSPSLSIRLLSSHHQVFIFL